MRVIRFLIVPGNVVLGISRELGSFRPVRPRSVTVNYCTGVNLGGWFLYIGTAGVLGYKSARARAYVASNLCHSVVLVVGSVINVRWIEGQESDGL